MALPKRLYYTLQQAVDKLEEDGIKYSTHDLIHFASIEKIELCTRISSNQYEKLYEKHIKNELDKFLSGKIDIHDNDFEEEQRIHNILKITYNQYGYRIDSDFNFDMVEKDEVFNTQDGISICFGNFIVPSLIDVRQTYNFQDKLVVNSHDFFEGFFAISSHRFQDREIDIVNNRITSVQENLFSIPRYLFESNENNDVWAYNVNAIELKYLINIQMEDLIILDDEFEKLKGGEENFSDINYLRKSVIGRKESTYKEVILDILKETRNKYPSCSGASLAKKIHELFKGKPNAPTCGTITKLISDNSSVPPDRDLKLTYELVIPDVYQNLKNK